MTLEQRLRALLRARILRFGAVGAAGFAVDETILALMHYAVGLDPYSARVVSILCTMIFTWWGNRIFTFAEHAARESVGAILREGVKFMLANGLGAVANYASYSLLVRFAPWPIGNPLLAAAIGVLIGLIFNFTLSKRFVFRAR